MKTRRKSTRFEPVTERVVVGAVETSVEGTKYNKAGQYHEKTAEFIMDHECLRFLFFIKGNRGLILDHEEHNT